MCAQHDLQVASKRLPRKEIPFNFHEFWSEELYYKKKRKTLVFKCYNLTDPMELFEVMFKNATLRS